MRIDLIELLARRPIAHPTHIKGITISQGRVEMVVNGYPWWAEAQRNTRPSQITLVFEGLSWGSLPVCPNDALDEDLDDFYVRPLAELEWAQPATEAIYCSGPIPDPIALYAQLQAHLQAAGAFVMPEDLLNQGTSLTAFLRLTSGNSFLLARAPAAICKLLGAELDRQGVPHTVLVHSRDPECRLWVRLQGRHFLCTTAYAILDAA